MQTLGLLLTVIGAVATIAAISLFIVRHNSYYKADIEKNGDPAKAKKATTRLLVLGILLVVVGILLSTLK